MTQNVLIVQRRLTHYRLALFNLLREKLIKEKIGFKLIVGFPNQNEVSKKDVGELDWAERIPTRYFGSLCWQPFEKYLKDIDLVIVTQENKLLYNQWLFVRPRTFRIAYWGHGKDMNSTGANRWSERFKAFTSRRVDWWFAYTAISADHMIKKGYPQERITVLENSIDSVQQIKFRDSIKKGEIHYLKHELGINSASVGIFIGSFYKEKHLEFLLDAAHLIKKKIQNFHLIMIGDGPEKKAIKEYSTSNPWIHIINSKFGREKALYLLTGDVLLNPGALGLGILDAFNFELPLVTTQCGLHGPEIAYLVSDINGLITPNTIEDFSNAALIMLTDRNARERIKNGCRESSRKYTIENMAWRFSTGIKKALCAGKYKL